MMNRPLVVNVYRVTRHFGGPEEGGWWCNSYECVHTEPLARRRRIETLMLATCDRCEDAYEEVDSR